MLKTELSHLGSLAKWLSVRLRTRWLWVRIPLLSLKLWVYVKNYVWKPSTCDCTINRYLKSIFDDSLITCDEIIKVSDSMSINLNDEKSKCRMEYYYILLTFLLVVILLAVTAIFYYCKKHRSKQNDMLPYY